MTETQDEIPVIQDDSNLNKKPISVRQATHLANARQIKKDRNDLKVKLNENYANELSNIHSHLVRLSTEMNTLTSAFGKRSSPEPSTTKTDEPEPKKRKVEAETESEVNSWIGMISQIIGASAAVGTLYLFKRYMSPDPDQAHVRRYENFTL